jgi:hypothetical protein
MAQWIQLNPNSNPGSQPKVQLISQNAFSSTIKVDLSGFMINEFEKDGKTYQSISLSSDEAVTSDAGFPEIKHIAKVLAIPDQGNVTVEIMETGPVQTFKGINIPPARESWIEGENETNYVENYNAYKSYELYPKKQASVDDPAVFRDFRIARVSIFPIRYSPAKKEIEVVSSITVRINYTPGTGINPKLTGQKPIAPSYAKLYKSFIFNYEDVLQERFGSREQGRDVMLCIMPDEWAASFQVYADWKHKTGTFIHVTKFSEIGASANNPTAIKNHILDAYTNWEYPPTHVLIVGDDGYAPVKYISYDWTFVNENYFVELEGNDFFAEMMIGRFTNQVDYRLQVMTNKFIGYEKEPYMDDLQWFKKATVCSNNAYQSQVETKRFTAQVLMENGNFFSVDTLMSDGYGSGCSMNLSDVIATIDEGRSFLNYRGEGWSSGWSANCYGFHTSDVNTLNNGRKLPFVTSIGCGVAMFDASGGSCFGEAFVQLGTLDEPRGAVAFIGPTSNTHTAYNNKIDKGIYIGMFQEGMDSPGEAITRGRLYLYEIYGNIMWVEYHTRIYCLLGDPSLHVWKDVPHNIEVTYPATIPVGFSQSQVKVTLTGLGLPVGNAEVCISGDDIFVTGVTDLSGTVLLDVTTTTVGELNLAVRGGDVVPFEGTIQIVAGTENVGLDGQPVVTDIDGNNDGLINPGENGTITFTLKNWGTMEAGNVQATLSVPAGLNTVDIVTTSPVVFGNIAPNASVTGSPFQFYVHPEFAVGDTIPFQLHVTSTTSSWDYYQKEIVHGCQLVYNEFTIDDEENLLHNYRMDPGETVNVIMKISNSGDDTAPDVIGILRSNDPYITITDSVSTFGTLLPDSNAVCDVDYFVVEVADNCPVEYEAQYSVILSTQNGPYPHQTVNPFIIPVGMPSGFDPTGPDGGGYYAFSSDDVLYRQSPVYSWIDISTIGTEIPRPGNLSDFTQTIGIPFTFMYYGNNFNQVRVSSDGWIAFGSGTQVAPENFSLPHLDDITNMVGIFWDDLFSENSGENGKLFYYYDTDTHRFIIEWYNVGHADDYTNKETFQVILFDPVYYPTQTGNGEIVCQYYTVSEEGSSAVGTEDGTELIGIDYKQNEDYNITATELRDGYALKFTTEVPEIISGVNEDVTGDIVPTDYVLEQNYPNPFNPETRIKYSIPEPGFVNLSIYRIDGELVRTLQEGTQLAGSYERIWDGKNGFGNKVGSGVYFYRLSSNNFIQVKKMILLK